jgi:asparagine synthase (glutamine-hydrolysing)
MALDTATYLPDDILTKVDRTSMAVSLEARVPLLDHRIMEFAWSLPQEYRFNENQGKRILQSLLEKYIPKELFDRPKVGFGVPIGEWLRGSLEDWAESLLSEKSLNEHGLLNTKIIRNRWEEHSTLKADWQYPLWDVLMFQAWYAANKY